jgi:hypothetical protein
MGNSLITYLKLADLPSEEYKLFLDEEYTVVRTNGMIQPGWKMRKGTHYCPNGETLTADHRRNGVAVVCNDDTPTAYKFFMVFDPCEESCRNACHNVEACGHLCGWRACYPEKRSFWPTRMTTDSEKEAWWAWVDGRLAYLESLKEAQKKQKEQEKASINA